MLALAEPLAVRLGVPAAPVAALLAGALAQTRTRWCEPAALDSQLLVDALLARIDGESDPAAALERLVLCDVLAVVACLGGDRAALAALEREVRTTAARVVARLGGNAPPAEDLVQELLVKLLVGPPPKLAAFTGHGPLHAWLHVAAMRTAISMMRRAREDSADDEVLAAIADDGDDQALAFLKQSYRAEFKRAFATALGALPPRSRTLLRMQVIDQLTYEEIAGFYQVSRATAARWLADARNLIVSETRRQLVDALEIDDRELAELMRLVESTLYSTLPRLLRQAA